MRLIWLVFVVAGRIGQEKDITVRNRDTSSTRIEKSFCSLHEDGKQRWDTSILQQDQNQIKLE